MNFCIALDITHKLEVKGSGLLLMTPTQPDSVWSKEMHEDGEREWRELACLFILVIFYKGMQLLKGKDRKIDGERQTGKQRIVGWP